MSNRLLFSTFILTLSTLFAACGGGTTVNVNTTAKNTNATNTTAAETPANAVATTKTPEAAAVDNAPTLTPVVTAYYEALKKKDDAGLRKVLSAETLKEIEADMKEEKKTSIAAYIVELEQVPEKPFEVRNEKITGDRAVAEIKGGSYGNWTPFTFAKENGEWKMTNESSDVDDVKKAAEASNTAR